MRKIAVLQLSKSKWHGNIPQGLANRVTGASCWCPALPRSPGSAWCDVDLVSCSKAVAGTQIPAPRRLMQLDATCLPNT